MTPPFQIGQEVEIIGPPLHQSNRFVIQEKRYDGSGFSKPGMSWYPASSLRLVEDLEIGDWVEVISTDNPFTGKIGQVSDIGEITVALYNMGCWNRNNLRKLAPAEIQQHLVATVGLHEAPPSSDYKQALTKACIKFNLPYNRPPMETIDTMLEMIGHDSSILERLSTIEKRLDTICQLKPDGVVEWMDIVEKRLDVLEGERPEICEASHDMDKIRELIGLPDRTCGCTKEDRQPNDQPISISICRGQYEDHTALFKCPGDALTWIKSVLEG
jgi:hypothetical protein